MNAPLCFETFEGGVTCLGSVQNTGEQTVSGVLLKVDYYDADDAILYSTVATLPQRTVPPGEVAPYRILYPVVESNGDSFPVDRVAGINVELLRAETTRRRGSDVAVTAASQTERDGQIHVTGDLTNTGEQPAQSVRVVVTVLAAVDRHPDRIVGFRVITLDEIDPQATVPFDVAITPPFPVMQTDFLIFVEADR